MTFQAKLGPLSALYLPKIIPLETTYILTRNKTIWHTMYDVGITVFFSVELL